MEDRQNDHPSDGQGAALHSGDDHPSDEQGAARNRSFPSHIVGIGASAGGLEALQTFFDHVPPNTGLAFVVIQHLSPDYKSLMVELLSKHTQMEVLRVEDGMDIRADCVYLIPPKKNMAVNLGRLYLSEQPERHGLNLPIDVFLRSLAEDQGEQAIAVILSGTGSDGTRGVRAVKGEGGMVIVQSEESAKFDGMPKSAISTGLADYVLPPERMPDELLKFINHPCILGKKEPYETMVKEEDSFTRILTILRKRTGVDFTYYKPSTMVRRIERRMGIVHANDLEDYIRHLLKDSGEANALFKDLLIGVTKFFRDTASYEMLRQTAIIRILENCAARKGKSVRVWTPGCSTGEEAYSLAMMFMDRMDTLGLHTEIKVFATDIDKEAVEFAGMGMYPDSIAADVKVGFLSRYFEKKPGGYQVRRSVRESVVFALQNLIKDPPFTKIDLISCRNLLIYFQPVLQKKVLSIFNYALLPDGYLFLGSSETVGEMSDAFDSVDSRHRIYRHRGQGALPIKETMTLSGAGRFVLPQYPKTDLGETAAAPPRRLERQESYYHQLLNKVAPALLITDTDRKLVQTFGNPREYLDVPLGNVSLDVLSMLPRELSLAVASAIHRTRKERKEVCYDNIRIREGDAARNVRVRADVIQGSSGERQSMFMILLEDVAQAAPLSQGEGEKTAPDTLMEERIRELEQEIQFTRENLQASIEELQTSNEELQATNEELLAANEELQSTNEELQSVNEELNTVNSEYQAKVLELSKLNNDMNNLMRSTDIGTVFLDRRLRIRKFTPPITKQINLLEQDIGRPLSDLSMPVLGSIDRDIRKVMESAKSSERTVSLPPRWFLLRILPFVDEHGDADGTVVTLVDISAQKKAEDSLSRQYDLLKRVLEASPAAQIMADRSGRIIFANRHAEKVFGLGENMLLDKALDSPELNMGDLEGKPFANGENPLNLILDSGEPAGRHIICVRAKDRELVVSVSGNPIFDEEGEIEGAVFKLEDIAHRSERSEK